MNTLYRKQKRKCHITYSKCHKNCSKQLYTQIYSLEDARIFKGVIIY